MDRWNGGKKVRGNDVCVLAGSAGRLRALDGVIMLSPDGGPGGGAFPDNLWLVMGQEGDRIEDFFGVCDDVLTADLDHRPREESRHYCVGVDPSRHEMVMNGGGAYPVYVSGLLRMKRKGLR
ncbi:MAG: hypothetical protein ACE5HD_10655 [Acidobacteriota bacterium]